MEFQDPPSPVENFIGLEGENNGLQTFFYLQQNTIKKFDDLMKDLYWKGFPCGLAGKESSCNAGHLGSFPVLGRSPGEGKGCPFQYSGLENSKNCIDC